MEILFIRRILPLFLLTILLMFSYAASAENIVLMAKKNSPVLIKLKSSLEKESESFNVSIMIPSLGGELPKDSYLINVGLLDVDEKIKQQAIGVISVLVSEKQSRSINDDSAIYVEPPFKRQFDLARLIFPGAKIGLLVADEIKGEKYLEQLSEDERLLLNVRSLSNFSNLNKALYKVLKDSSLLLGVYDDSIYNTKNIKNILITSYRQQKVLIGPSKAYLKAGSFATTYSGLSHVAKRISDIVTLHIKENRWLKPDYNPYYSVRFNNQVANSLNIQAFDSADILKRMGELQ